VIISRIGARALCKGADQAYRMQTEPVTDDGAEGSAFLSNLARVRTSGRPAAEAGTIGPQSRPVAVDNKARQTYARLMLVRIFAGPRGLGYEDRHDAVRPTPGKGARCLRYGDEGKRIALLLRAKGGHRFDRALGWQEPHRGSGHAKALGLTGPPEIVPANEA
jgi:hypothetical protein